MCHCLARDPSVLPRFAPSESRSHASDPPSVRGLVLHPSDPPPASLMVSGSTRLLPPRGHAWLFARRWRGSLISSGAAVKSPSPRGPLYHTTYDCCRHSPNFQSFFLPPPQHVALIINWHTPYRVCSLSCLFAIASPRRVWLHAGVLRSPRHENSACCVQALSAAC